MTGKRKRRTDHSVEGANKRYRLSPGKPLGDGLVRYSLLSHYYMKVLTLREYLLSKLPATSKKRRKKVIYVNSTCGPPSAIGGIVDQHALAWHLDQTLVGVSEEAGVYNDERWKQWTSFSQLADYSESTIRSGKGSGDSSLCEVRKNSIKKSK
jgi:hypothetical protein